MSGPVAYVAACPACGQDAPWRSVVVAIELPSVYEGRAGQMSTGVAAHCDCACDEPVAA